MANVHLLSVRVLDDDGTPGNVNIFLPSTLTLANIQTFADTFIVKLDAVTGCKIDSASVALALTLPGGLKAGAVAGTPVQWGANFSFDAADTPYRWTLHIPGVDQGIVVGDSIDVAPQYVVDFIAAMVDGVATFEPTDRYGNDLEALLGAVVSFRKA